MNRPRINWWSANFGEAAALAAAEALRNRRVSMGALVAELEERLSGLLDGAFVVATTSGSDALLMCMLALEVGSGDEAVCPVRTWIATAHAPYVCGARVRLADTEPGRPVLDPEALAAVLSERTKVILPVHLNGRAVDMESVNALARKHGAHVVEDAAQAFLSRPGGRLLGLDSTASCFSLSVAKLLSSGQGGFVATRDRGFAEILRSIRSHGVEDLMAIKYRRPGFNFKPTDILAAVALSQLPLLERRIEHLKAVYRAYRQGLAGLPFISLAAVAVDSGETPLYAEALCPERGRLCAWLAASGVETRPSFLDLHHAEYFGEKGPYPNARRFSDQGFYLPCGPDQRLEDVDAVIRLLHEYTPGGSAEEVLA